MELQLKDDLKTPTKDALQHFIDVIQRDISPKLLKLNGIFQIDDVPCDGDASRKNQADLFMLCSDQILKCACLMADVFKREITTTSILEESRCWVFDRIVWCLKKIEHLFTAIFDKNNPAVNAESTNDEESNLSIFPKENFISWVDDTLKILEMFENLFTVDSDSFSFHNQNNEDWINECASGLLSFHKVIRQLIFSAMDICQNCLPEDQRVISARCHVVLRESKNFIEEILESPSIIMGENEELNIESLQIKRKLHYPTVRILNDVLKDAVYNLETSVNKGVLSIVLKCLRNPNQPLDDLLQSKKNEIIDEDSMLIRDFDVHSERIIQIGLFAISCSSDKHRVLQLKSCLASLEIIELHLIPTILAEPDNAHTQFLIEHWIDEMKLLQRCVFLIIDPVAFIELILDHSSKDIKMLKKLESLDRASVLYLLSVGRCAYEYFSAYYKWEPAVLDKYKNLNGLIVDLEKVVDECEAVVNAFLPIDEMKPNLKTKKNQDARVLKRFKLLHSLLLKISDEFVGNNQSLDFESEDMPFSVTESTTKRTQIISKKTSPGNKNKGIFKMFDVFKGLNKPETAKNAKLRNANKTLNRSTIIRPMKSLSNDQDAENFNTQSFKPILKRLIDINSTLADKSMHDVFSASGIFNYLDEEYILANVSTFDQLDQTSPINFKMDETKTRSSVFYSKTTKRKHGTSLRRKALINRANMIHNLSNDDLKATLTSQKEEIVKTRSVESLNKSLDLHITDILEQITTLSDTISLMKIDYTPEKKPLDLITLNVDEIKAENKNVLTIKINESNTPVKTQNASKLKSMTPKKIWSIKISEENKENAATPKNISVKNKTADSIDCGIDVSFESDILTPERLNDLQALEKKLAELKQFWAK